MLEIFNDIEQGSDEWHQLRCGVVTASVFSQVLAKGQGKTRRTLLLKKAAERITENPAECYTNIHMERGKEQEPLARDLYVQYSTNEVVECGFMKKEKIGYSPDGLIGEDGLIEIKSRLAHIQADILLLNEVPNGDVAQVQGALLVSGRKYIDYISFCPGMPLLIRRVVPDISYQKNLAQELETFEHDLEMTVKKLMSKWEYQGGHHGI